MVNTSCTLTCDHCHRYLKDGQQTVVEFGELQPLLAEAEDRGWLLEWNLGSEEDEPARSLCPDCAKKESDQHQEELRELIAEGRHLAPSKPLRRPGEEESPPARETTP